MPYTMDELDDIKTIAKSLTQLSSYLYTVSMVSLTLTDEEENQIGALVFDGEEWKFLPLEGK